MEYLITEFNSWRTINEEIGPGRTKQTAGFGQKIVGIPIDDKSFKLKIINDLDVIDTAGKITDSGGTNIITWLLAQVKWKQYYTGLSDLVNNFLLYSVSVDNDRKQLITFTITPVASAPGLPKGTKFVRKEDLTAVVKDATASANILGAAEKAAKTAVDTKVGTPEADSPIKLDKPIAIKNIGTLSNTGQIYGLIDDVYVKLIGVSEISSLEFFPKVKLELKAGKLGENTIKLITGLIAGFNIRDKYGDLSEVINQAVVNKLYQVTQAGLTESKIFEGTIKIKDLNIEEFIKAVQDTSTVKEVPAANTSGIVIPKEGLKKSETAKGDSNIKKLQELISTKFKDKLKDSPLFQKFVGYGADGVYGPTTEKMIAGIKAGLKLSDKDGSIITQEFIDKIISTNVNESYIDLNYRLFEQFDMSAFTDTVKTYTPTKKSEEKSSNTTQDDKNTVSVWIAKESDTKIAKNASLQIDKLFKSTPDFWDEVKTWKDDDEVKANELWTNWFDKTINPEIEKLNDKDPNKQTLKNLKNRVTEAIFKQRTFSWTIIDSSNESIMYSCNGDI